MKKIIISVLHVFVFVFFTCPAETQDRQEIKPSLSVETENSLFSVSAKAKEGIMFYPAVKGAAGKIDMWLFIVRNEKGDIVKTLSGKKSIPEKIVWDGSDNLGSAAVDGRYRVELYARAGKSEMRFENPDIVIDTTPPFVSVASADNVYFIDGGGKINKSINLYLSCGDENGIDYAESSVKVFNYKNNEIKSFKFTETIPETIMWNGIDDIYDAFIRPGNYKIVFSVSDKAGNKESVKYEISVIESAQTVEGSKTE
ncbi:MAG: hypothetical protein LBR69_00875 [Endomicrobium sp.]|jgi:flagellar hook assembly protein FlgD|nr:hypothetical protein [Endomicrobium sp.]